MDAFFYDHFHMYEIRQDIAHVGGHMARRNVHTPIMERRLAVGILVGIIILIWLAQTSVKMGARKSRYNCS